MYQSLLVPLDGSDFAEQALRRAGPIARKTGALVTLLHVCPLPGSSLGLVPSSPDDLDLERQRLRGYLTRAADGLRGASDLRVETALLDGNPWEVVCEYVAIRGVDLVVMTTHGRSGWSRAWLGSVADGVVRHAATPVLLDTQYSLSGQPGTDLFRHILVALDGSDAAEEVLLDAWALSVVGRPRYTFVRVVEPDDALRRATAEEYLHTIALRFAANDPGAEIVTRVMVHDSPQAAILSEARRGAADLIALTTHARRGVTRVMLGSVADKVVRGSDCAVLLLRPRLERRRAQ